MQHFPVSSSILSASHLAQFVRGKYKLSQSSTCQLLKAGVNHTYLITDGPDKFVFRVYSLNWRTLREINEEIALLKLVKANDIRVSYSIADISGEYIQAINAPEGQRYGVLFSFAAGEKLLTFSPELHYELGKIMARFHQLTQDQPIERITYTPNVLLVDSLEKVKPFLPADSEEMQFLMQTQRYMLGEFARIDTTQTRWGVVHLDIWFDNLNIAEDGAVTLFDFDFCGNAMLCLDLAYYILQIHSTETDVEEFYKKRDYFLAGYESITELSAEEKRLLPMLAESVYFYYLGIQCERFDNWSNVFLNDLYLKRFINLRIKRWFDFNKLNENS
ncbi:phosphotransferase [Spirosoma sp. KNUC1025]|uniref:phosphotransferase n=1 Tax=Spirosoma sp. KNUC1025 TaxID=2894082 RepID=UPI00386D85CF|nr:phosphotransferase [Spirosoma sp. KNUC1025]